MIEHITIRKLDLGQSDYYTAYAQKAMSSSRHFEA